MTVPSSDPLQSAQPGQGQEQGEQSGQFGQPGPGPQGGGYYPPPGAAGPGYGPGYGSYPPPPYGYPGYPGFPPPNLGTNTMSILSLIFAFVFAPLGIVFGIIGL